MAPGAFLLKVSATDADLIMKPQYYLTGPGSEKYSLDQVTGQLTVLKPLDREEKSEYSLKVTVRDGGNADWECTCKVKISLTDENDNAPVFSQPSYSVNIPENSPENYLLMKIHATDLDQGKKNGL